MFLTIIFTILRRYPHWFISLFIIWIIIGACILVWFLKRLLSVKRLPKGFSSLKTISDIFKTSPRWLQLTLIVWVVTGLFLSLYFFVEYQKPIFSTDRHEKEICFTVLKYPFSNAIKITDIKLGVFSHDKLETRATVETRLDLYVDTSRDNFPQDEKKTTVELNTQKSISIFPSNQIIEVNRNSSASFRVKFRGNRCLTEVKFCIIVEYLDCVGNKKQLVSDKVYIVSKGSKTENIGRIDVVDYEKFIH